ncbi:Bifunctional inhibitor/lipid-transfer protein/seed storage 2S albumin protein [Dioscorea alata]|uniref:Bifunctional inhibitor/lipid-transfer protein/seed storage 2S albumin protein n=1 Tax=Dioscorea alata TaxID=55571 RepID=A0ACB7TZ22_DIOAL|nr:Bifunctional inhibitor/lipid-transfer protein/seed storage 2S albumin protein [Dioscorea alata]
MLSKFKLVLLVLLTQSITHTLLKAQVINACDFRVDQLVPCLSMQENNTSENEVCCNALSLAISAGYRCFCSILSSPNLNFMASISPLLNSSLELPFLGCHLPSPSLSVCQGIEMSSSSSAAVAPSVRIVSNLTVKEEPNSSMNIAPQSNFTGSSAEIMKIKEGWHAVTFVVFIAFSFAVIL